MIQWKIKKITNIGRAPECQTHVIPFKLCGYSLTLWWRGDCSPQETLEDLLSGGDRVLQNGLGPVLGGITGSRIPWFCYRLY